MDIIDSLNQRQKNVKSVLFTHVDYCGVKDCTFEGIELEDGSVDYTLLCELNKSIDKQPSR